MCGYKADGKRKTKSFYGKTEAEVKEKLAKYRMRSLPIEQRLDQECFFQEWADIWFENHKWRISKTTQDSYGYTLRTLKTYFENTRLRDIRPMDVEIMLRKMWEEGKSRSYLSSCRGMLFQIMNKAEANDLIAKNPVRLAEKIRYTNPVGRKDAFTSEEMEILMKKLPQNRIGWSIRLLLNTGMRTQELLALEPKHIALDGSSIRVYQAVKMEKGTAVVGETKNASSYREIPVPSYVRYCAVALRNTDKKYIWEAKKENQPCNPSYFRDQFSEALDSVPEVRKLTPHCCRHTYVSELIAHGVEVFTIQSLTGHTQMKMVAHYTHIRQKVREEAVEKLSETFGQA